MQLEAPYLAGGAPEIGSASSSGNAGVGALFTLLQERKAFERMEKAVEGVNHFLDLNRLSVCSWCCLCMGEAKHEEQKYQAPVVHWL